MVESPELAQLVCDWYGSRCKAFVYLLKLTEVYLKSDVTGKMESFPGRSLYIKKTHTKGIKLPLDNMCAVATNRESSPESLDQNQCQLLELNPFDASIMKYIQKPAKLLECRGVPLTTYQLGKLEILRPSKGV